MTWGVYLSAGTALDPATNLQLHALARRLLEAPAPGVTDVIPGYTNLFIEVQPGRVPAGSLRRWLSDALASLEQAPAPRTLRVPVRYDGEDLIEVAARTGLSPAQVVERHAGVDYQVFAMGFTPGFAFMGVVDPAIRVPRRTNPRARVPAHAVAVANDQTGVYPLPTPGGWNLLGTALSAMLDLHRPEPFLLRPGDRVRFVESEGATPAEPRPLDLLPPEPRWPTLRVLRPGLLDLVVDEGRFGMGRFGLSRGGPADAALARLANRLLGNRDASPLLEMSLTGPTLEVLRDAVVVVTGWAMMPMVNGREQDVFTTFAVRRGDTLAFRPGRAGCRSYLAVAGGIASERFMGSASVDLKSGIGRPLGEGMVLGVAGWRTTLPGHRFRPYQRFQDPAWIRLLPGPQPDPEALAVLTSAAFTVAGADRMGLLLAGPRVPGGDVTSEATPLGAVQVTSGGTPILLLVDRGTMGGYAKPAVVHPADLGRVAQLRPGARVRFRRAPAGVPMRTLALEDVRRGMPLIDLP